MNRMFLLVLVLLFAGSVSAQLPSQDPGHKEYAEIAGIKFSVPKRFDLQKPTNQNIAFMLRAEYGLGLFVAVPEGKIDDHYLTNLSSNLAARLFPQDSGFDWKLLPEASFQKVSDFEVATGNTKGFVPKKLVQTDYIVLNVKRRDVVVGYVTRLGRDADAKYLFDLKGPAGMSMPGWHAEAHVIASITGEKYERINPGTEIIGTPLKKP
jgi:hypothetical protein